MKFLTGDARCNLIHKSFFIFGNCSLFEHYISSSIKLHAMKKNLLLLLVTLFLASFVVYYSCQKKIDTSSAGQKSELNYASGAAAAAATPIQVYGVWHAGNDACTWASVRTISEFDSKNHWLIDRGDGSGKPSVNLVILSF